MGSVHLSEVFSPQFRHYYPYRHNFFIEQYKILPLCCTTRHASVHCNFLQNSRNLTIESSLTKKTGFRNEMECGRLIMDLTSDGFYADAVTCYLDMLDRGFITENFFSFPALVKAVGALRDVELVRQINGYLIKVGVVKDIYVANSLVSAFWKCGAVDDAVRMFMNMEVDKDFVSWNAMISGFHHSGLFHKSLELFAHMISESGTYPNRVACLSALSSCASLKSVIHGREIHAYVIKNELDVDEFVLNGLLDMYMNCSCVGHAEKLFEIHLEHAGRNTVLWNVMISGYVDDCNFSKAVQCFIQMLFLQIKPDSSTIVALLVSSSKSIDLALGKQIHAHAMKTGLDLDIRVRTSLTDMYFKCATPESAFKIFDRFENRNLVMWGTMITNCSRSGYPMKAMDLYVAALKHGFIDNILLLAALRACSSLTTKPEGMTLHGVSVKLGLESEIYIGSALIDMYMKCRDTASAKKTFSRVPLDEISWSNLMSGYAQNESWDDALETFSEMHNHGIRLNAVILASILSVCASVFGNLQCREVHGYILRNGFETNTLVNNALIVAYAKTGNVSSSKTVFSLMVHKDEVSWNSILLALGLHGDADEAVIFFDKMKKTGLNPDHQTFTAVLSAFSHTGRVTDGLNYFRTIVDEHNLEPRIEQYTCLVDLLGRGGYLDEAYVVITTMPCSPDARIWGSLLNSCRIYGNEKLAEIVAKNVFELDPDSIGYRVLLANLYEDGCKLKEFTRVRETVKEMGLKKSPGCSWIEVENRLHVFTASDRSHFRAEDVYMLLNSLTPEMIRYGYARKYSDVKSEFQENGINPRTQATVVHST